MSMYKTGELEFMYIKKGRLNLQILVAHLLVLTGCYDFEIKLLLYCYFIINPRF